MISFNQSHAVEDVRKRKISAKNERERESFKPSKRKKIKGSLESHPRKIEGNVISSKSKIRWSNLVFIWFFKCYLRWKKNKKWKNLAQKPPPDLRSRTPDTPDSPLLKMWKFPFPQPLGGSSQSLSRSYITPIHTPKEGKTGRGPESHNPRSWGQKRSPQLLTTYILSGGAAWRIIPVSKWLITMVSFRPLSRVLPPSKTAIHGLKKNGADPITTYPSPGSPSSKYPPQLTPAWKMRTQRTCSTTLSAPKSTPTQASLMLHPTWKSKVSKPGFENPRGPDFA